MLAGPVLAAALVAGGCTDGGGDLGGDPADGFHPGAASAGDSYFPEFGNGGYDVEHYHLRVTYDPAREQLSGVATITATTTADLSSVSLDLTGLTVREATVDGEAATVTHTDQKLTVVPPAGVPSGEKFTLAVTYDGRPEPVDDPQLGSNGFHHTADGAFAIGQPRSASTWFPVNDHPRDKATYTIEITVPEGLAGVSNGVPQGRTTDAGWTTWRWAERVPMASYLTTLVIGDYRVGTATHDDGRPLVTAVHAGLPDGVDRQIRRTGDIADALVEWFGPYPAEAYGGIVLADDRIGFALETQSRPTYGPGFFRGGQDASWVIVHELAHQWFGNSVSLDDWRDMWLNEGFATYAEWLWEERSGGLRVQQSFDFFYDRADDAFWQIEPGNPGPDRIFHPAVYRRGAMTVHALRLAVGDEDFFRILTEWTSQYRDRNATTTEFVTLAEKVSGESLRPLLDQWLYTPERPPHPD
jgi:aminopeptidase N